ncbi:MAG: sn-glycerol-3-phosphate ABC transporter ATP-binding protein UgpC [Gammaproteobacteria bacterium]
MSSRVEFRSVTKRYDNGPEIIRSLSLTIEPGEFMVLLGPSGCGKSTLLRMLAGLEDITGGEILIDRSVVNEMTPQQRNVAMVFQNYALYPHMSVRGNLAFPLKMRGMPKREIEAHVMQAAQTLGIGALLERKPAQLSGGQRQRVAMGRAIVREPSVFLMDEPLSNLDAKLRSQIRGEIAALQRRMDTTTLYVTHDQVEAMTLGHRVAVLHAGRLQQIDTPAELYARPANLFVAGFLGSPAMNLLQLPPADARDARRLDFGDQSVPLDAPIPPAAATVGIRPESFEPAATNERGSPIEVAIVEVEALGHEQILHFESPLPLRQIDAGTPSGLMTARISATPPLERGQHIRLTLRTNALHWFDRDGQRL